MKHLSLVSCIIIVIYLVLLVPTLLFVPISEWKNGWYTSRVFIFGGTSHYDAWFFRGEILLLEVAALTVQRAQPWQSHLCPASVSRKRVMEGDTSGRRSGQVCHA